MNTPHVSVVIPAYNQADFLGEAIQSVLDQTFADFEVLVVNDASPDHTTRVVEGFDDPRVRLLVHETNRGLPAARNTGLRAARGEIVALLDSDDLFHPHKLRVHVDYLAAHPDVGVSYNGRFELNHGARTIRALWRPPLRVGLADLVQGFPFSPSDMVMRRAWAQDVGLFDEGYLCGGEDTDQPCRLSLAGCRFASVDRALNYRRYHSGRYRSNIDCRLGDVQRTLEATFADPRCPAEVRALRELAYVHHYLVLVYHAFALEETARGQALLGRAVEMDPSLLLGEPCPLLEHLLAYSIWDENLDHEVMLRRFLAQMPMNLGGLWDRYPWAVWQGYLRRGAANLLWGREAAGQAQMAQAATMRVGLDRPFLTLLADQLAQYEGEMGSRKTDAALARLTRALAPVGTAADLSWLRGTHAANRAFRNYRAGRYPGAAGSALRALISHPPFLRNRGLHATLARSLLGMAGVPTPARRTTEG